MRQNLNPAIWLVPIFFFVIIFSDRHTSSDFVEKDNNVNIEKDSKENSDSNGAQSFSSLAPPGSSTALVSKNNFDSRLVEQNVRRIAQEMPTRKLEFIEPAQSQLRDLPLHLRESLGDRSWKVVMGLSLVPEVSFKSGGEVYGRVQQLVISTSESTPFAFKGSVVYDTERKMYGVLTGTFILELNSNASDIDDIVRGLQQEYGLALIQGFSQIGHYVFSSNSGDDINRLNQLLSKLQNDKRIQAARPELLVSRFRRN